MHCERREGSRYQSAGGIGGGHEPVGAALAGALAAALTQMVAGLTARRKKFAHVADEVQAVLAQVVDLRHQLTQAITEDAEAFFVFRSDAERANGRAAMVGITAWALIEAVTGAAAL